MLKTVILTILLTSTLAVIVVTEVVGWSGWLPKPKAIVSRGPVMMLRGRFIGKTFHSAFASPIKRAI